MALRCGRHRFASMRPSYSSRACIPGTVAYFRTSVKDALAMFVLHIPDVNFRVIRYGGFYANRLRGQLLPVVFALKNSKRTYAQAKEHLAKLTCWWRRRIEAITRIDPLICDICLIPLTLFSVVYSLSNPDPYG